MLELLMDIRQTLGGISRRLERIEQKEDIMAMDLSALEAAVKADDEADASAIILLKGLADQIAALKPDRAAIDAFAAKLRTNAATLSAAVVANTPAADPADPPPPPIVP